jgi:oxygen-independent coproporphyrinogen-3 oxidase
LEDSIELTPVKDENRSSRQDVAMNAPYIAAPALLQAAGRMVPRYTSYPTAPHFSAAVDGGVYADWLSRLRGTEEPVSIYLHVPFCRTICNYCGCTTKAALRDDPIRAYVDTLRREIALVAEKLGAAPVSHIHWGGGTPNILPPDCLAEIVGDLAAAFRFQPGMEHAIELDPRHVTLEGARHLASLGVNRASLGVQTLDPAVQTAIAREQPLSAVERSFDVLRASGISAINVDLMFGLPRQTLASIADTARSVVALDPSRFAIFGYAHVPWMKSHQKLIDAATLPGAEERLRQAALARELVEAGGYVEVGIDHFAREHDELAVALRSGRLRRNFQGYTTDGAATLIGIGASSISRTPAGFAQNAPDNAGWRRAIEAGGLPTARGKAFEGDDLLRGEVIGELLCYFEADLGGAAARQGATASVFADDMERLAPMEQAGWLEVRDNRVIIRRHRHEIARLVASAFDAYLMQQGGRHSVAV